MLIMWSACLAQKSLLKICEEVGKSVRKQTSLDLQAQPPSDGEDASPNSDDRGVSN